MTDVHFGGIAHVGKWLQKKEARNTLQVPLLSEGPSSAAVQKDSSKSTAAAPGPERMRCKSPAWLAAPGTALLLHVLPTPKALCTHAAHLPMNFCTST